MIKVDAQRKFENTLLENFSVDHIRALKRSNWSGLLMEIDRLYATMFHEWDALQKDVTDIEEAVRSLTWSVNPFTRDGEEPDPLAAEVAKTVQDALWRRSEVVPGSVGHTFQQLLGALVHAVYRGFNVHQIEWRNDGELVYPARFIQLPPQFLMWENRAGEPDRLLLVPDGMNYKGVPFPAHKFIVALNTAGPDHPIYNATFYSLVNWFLAFKKGISWFMEYTQKYGMPKQILHYQSDRDRAQLMADLRDDSVLNTILLKEGRDIDIQYPTGGSASLPQAVLLQKAEEACHKAILGQTLTSDTSSNGGSLAQAKVHAGVQSDIVLKRAEFVADILNQQLIPAIVVANYGRLEGVPMPELRCKLPQAVANIERAQFLKTALEVPGIEIVKSEAYEYLGLAMPAEGDEVLKAPDQQQQQQPGGMPGGMFGSPEDPQLDAGRFDEVTSARKAPAPVDPTEEWLAPLKNKLAEARESGASLAEIKDQLRAWRPNTRALAAAMAKNIKEGFLGGNTENVAAENPYGCNQHGHGWVDSCPYGGDGAGPASKGAIAIAGGAENVTPQDDDEEEKKKKEEAEAAAKAEAERKAKEEAERRAREEAEARMKAEAEAKKNAIIKGAEDAEQKWSELEAAYSKKLEEQASLSGTKEYKKAQEILGTIKWHNDSLAHWKSKIAEGEETDKEKALASLQFVSSSEHVAKNMLDAEKKIKAAFNKLKKATALPVSSAPVEENSKRVPLNLATAKNEDILTRMQALPSEKEAVQSCALLSKGSGGIVSLWNTKLNSLEKYTLQSYSGEMYEVYNEEFRSGQRTSDTIRFESIFSKAKLPAQTDVVRGEDVWGFGEYGPDCAQILKDMMESKITQKDARQRLCNLLQGKIKSGTPVIRSSNAPTSTAVHYSRDFEMGVMRLIHIPKGAKALSLALVSKYDGGKMPSTDEKISPSKYISNDRGRGEREILIGPNSRFRTNKVYIGADGILYIEDELLLN